MQEFSRYVKWVSSIAISFGRKRKKSTTFPVSLITTTPKEPPCLCRYVSICRTIDIRSSLNSYIPSLLLYCKQLVQFKVQFDLAFKGQNNNNKQQQSKLYIFPHPQSTSIHSVDKATSYTFTWSDCKG